MTLSLFQVGISPCQQRPVAAIHYFLLFLWLLIGAMMCAVLSQLALLLLLCVELTLAITDHQAENNQIHGEDLYADVYIHEDADSFENVMGCGTDLLLQLLDRSNLMKVTPQLPTLSQLCGTELLV